MQTANAESPPSGHSTLQSALPPDVSLKQLQLNFGHNLYCLDRAKRCSIGAFPGRRTRSITISPSSSDLSFAEDGAVEQLRLKDSSAYDLRIPAHSLEMECYPRGTVPRGDS